MKKFVELGSQERWWCPECGRVFMKATFTLDHRAVFGPGSFHSGKCRTPMQRVTVTLAPAALSGQGEPQP